MAFLADRWYDVGPFWAVVAGVLGTVVLGFAGARLARLVRPRRRISYRVPHRPVFSETDLLTLRKYKAADDSATLTLIRLANSGSRAVTSEMYDSAKPVVLDLHAEIREISSYESRPKVIARPPIEWTAPSQIAIGPGLLAPGQVLDIAVVTAGPSTLSIEGSLIDVRLDSAHPSWLRFISGALAAFAGGCTALAAATAAHRVVDGDPPRFGRLAGISPLWGFWQDYPEFAQHTDAVLPYVLLYVLGVAVFGAAVVAMGTKR